MFGSIWRIFFQPQVCKIEELNDDVLIIIFNEIFYQQYPKSTKMLSVIKDKKWVYNTIQRYTTCSLVCKRFDEVIHRQVTIPYLRVQMYKDQMYTRYERIEMIDPVFLYQPLDSRSISVNSYTKFALHKFVFRPTPFPSWVKMIGFKSINHLIECYLSEMEARGLNEVLSPRNRLYEWIFQAYEEQI